jgi:phage N-6-adenine-methyltransferase
MTIVWDFVEETALSADEQSRLQQHEEVIERGLKTFYDVGSALLDIRKSRLYRQQYSTFEAYCEQRWGMSKTHANRIIESAEVAANLTPMGVIPANERQTRELVGLEPAQQRVAWEVVEKTAPNGHVTAGHVKSVVNVMRDVLNTGAIDGGDGVDIPIQAATIDHLKAAVLEETEERMARQALHIAESTERRLGKREASGDTPPQSSVHFSSLTPEWYTPEHLMKAVWATLGPIELDPASSAAANAIVRADRFFTIEDNGLRQQWLARTVFMNPPYGDVIGEWVARLAEAYENGHVGAALALVPARTDTGWFRRLRAYPRCFITGRIKFWTPDGSDNSAPFPSAVFYLGDDMPRFASAFAPLGDIYALWGDA